MKVMVTGGYSMIGRSTCDLLRKRNYVVDQVSHTDCDFLSFDQTKQRIEAFNPDYIIHLAGYNGSIKWNAMYPEEIFFKTSQMALNVLGNCHNAKKIISIISSCAYPDMGDSLLKENDFWNGLPNSSVECHGLSKRALHAFSRQINKVKDVECICAVVNNSYGPFDSFDLIKTKAVAGLIKKFVEEENVVCWGTGKPRREFVYCKDVAFALVEIMENWQLEYGDLVNVGSGIDYSIKELAEAISDITGNKNFSWDVSKPDGQMRKLLDSSLIKEKIGFETKYSLEQGLKETIEWFKHGTTAN